MSILKLKPSCKDYLWGGHRLAEEYGVKYDGRYLQKPGSFPVIRTDHLILQMECMQGKHCRNIIDIKGKEVLGLNCRRFRDFPILTKFIDAKQSFSVQVHPSNRYALKNEGQYGKTEMWYVMDADPGCLFILWF